MNPLSQGGGACASSSLAFVDQNGITHWLGAEIASSNQFEHANEINPHFQQQPAQMVTELNLAAAHGLENSFPDLGQHSRAGDVPTDTGGVPTYVGGVPTYTGDSMIDSKPEEDWEELRRRCLIVTHPRYPEMLVRHAECLRVVTPVDQLPIIEAQLAEASAVTEKYRVLRTQILETTPEEQADLDNFMAGYPPLLAGFRDTLQEHVKNDFTEAMMSCWQLEQGLKALMGQGVRMADGCGATMSDEDNDYDSDYGSYDCNDSSGFGPLVPSETERTLMERVRQELKHDLKQGYHSKIKDVRDEILRKRSAGKLPEGTTDVLKAWWEAHSKWPYPTDKEKEVLIKETGLELKQVNYWFVNQRKRCNWNHSPLASAQASNSSGKKKGRKRK